MSLYEGMFILDNEAVRADWKSAKALVTETLTKHGAEVVGARRWDERKLAYPIKRRKRGTYLLAYYDIDTESIDGLRRDLELSENVLRYLLLRTDEVPADEAEKCRAEDEEGYAPPPPPEEEEPEPEPEPRAAAPREEAPAEKAEAPEQAEAAEKAEAGEESGEPAAEEAGKPAAEQADEPAADAAEKKEEA